MGENRYMICGRLECYVTFFKDSTLCSVRMGESNFQIEVAFLKVIASPAP